MPCFPDIQIYNASPHSSKCNLPFIPISNEKLLRVLSTKTFSMPFRYLDPEVQELWSTERSKNHWRWRRKVTLKCSGIYKGNFYMHPCRKKEVFEEQKENLSRLKANEKYEDRFKNEDCFICAPGPSFRDAPIKLLREKLTIGVNSLGFAFKPKYWLLAEWEYVENFFRFSKVYLKCLENQEFFFTTRAYLLWLELTEKYDSGISRINNGIWIDIKERNILPPAIGTPSILLALAQAWWMGCKRTFILGMDLCRPNNQTYIKNIPYTEKGLHTSFDKQIYIYRQTFFPGMEIYNASPYSKQHKLAFKSISNTELEKILRNEKNE